MDRAARIYSRYYEDTTVAEQALREPTSNFVEDFRRVVSFCINHCWNEENRRAQFNMPPEPYCPDHSVAYSEDELTDRARHLVEERVAAWQNLYETLSDTHSKLILLTVLAYRALGWRHVKLPLDNNRFWSCISVSHTLPQGNTQLKFSSTSYIFPCVDLRSLGISIKIFTDPFGVFNEFIYSQYVYRGDEMIITPEKDDIVIDCGACFGGTSLFFATCVGGNGKVLSFEFMKHNIELFSINMALNKKFSTIIELIPHPVWDKSGENLYVIGSGPAAQVSPEPNSDSDLVKTKSIDDLVREKNLPIVDFIKMDIEGSEFYALRGATETIKKFKPKLAICVYHKLIDFFELPQIIKEMQPDYKIYYQHASVHGDETLIFAI